MTYSFFKIYTFGSGVVVFDDFLVICVVCFRDGIHLSSEGSKIVAKEILKVIRDANWEPNLYYKSMQAEFEEDSPYDHVNFEGNTTLNISQSFSQKNMHLDLEICNEDEIKISTKI